MKNKNDVNILINKYSYKLKETRHIQLITIIDIKKTI
jgi:hypothetical protein